MYLAKYIAKCATAEDIQLVKISPVLGGQKRIPPSDAALVTSDGKNDSSIAQPVLPDQNDEPPSEKVPYDRVTKDDSDVKRFLTLRVVNILEAVMLCFGYPQVGCSRLIIFLPIDIVPGSCVVMRKKHREAAKGDSPYYDTKLEKYFLRSELLEDVTYQQYFEQYYVKYDRKSAPEEPEDYARDDEEENMWRDNSTFFVDQTAAKRKWVRRANPARYAVGRFRHFAPHGDNVESYCLIKLLKAKPARRSTVEGWTAEFGSYLFACVHLGLVEKGAEALHFLEECAMERFDDLRLREMVERFKEQGWLEDPDIDGLLETLAPAHQAIRNAREDVIAQAATNRCRNAEGSGNTSHLPSVPRTGIAAHLISGRTVHNFLGIDFEFKSRIQHGTFQGKALSDTQMVFVDEVSMMPREALTMLDETLREFNNQNSGAPFAGKSHRNLGDSAQLQAVGKAYLAKKTGNTSRSMEKAGKNSGGVFSLRVGHQADAARNLQTDNQILVGSTAPCGIVEELTDDSIIVYQQSHAKRRLPSSDFNMTLPSKWRTQNRRDGSSFRSRCTVARFTRRQGHHSKPCVYDADRQLLWWWLHRLFLGATGFQRTIFFVCWEERESSTFFLRLQLKQLLGMMDVHAHRIGCDSPSSRSTSSSEGSLSSIIKDAEIHCPPVAE
ncbi:hypothetical protein BV898_10312, partial [Hypsibius exemplaris]